MGDTGKGKFIPGRPTEYMALIPVKIISKAALLISDFSEQLLNPIEFAGTMMTDLQRSLSEQEIDILLKIFYKTMDNYLFLWDLQAAFKKTQWGSLIDYWNPPASHNFEVLGTLIFFMASEIDPPNLYEILTNVEWSGCKRFYSYLLEQKKPNSDVLKTMLKRYSVEYVDEVMRPNLRIAKQLIKNLPIVRRRNSSMRFRFPALNRSHTLRKEAQRALASASGLPPSAFTSAGQHLQNPATRPATAKSTTGNAKASANGTLGTQEPSYAGDGSATLYEGTRIKPGDMERAYVKSQLEKIMAMSTHRRKEKHLTDITQTLDFPALKPIKPKRRRLKNKKLVILESIAETLESVERLNRETDPVPESAVPQTSLVEKKRKSPRTKEKHKSKSKSRKEAMLNELLNTTAELEGEKILADTKPKKSKTKRSEAEKAGKESTNLPLSTLDTSKPKPPILPENRLDLPKSGQTELKNTLQFQETAKASKSEVAQVKPPVLEKENPGRNPQPSQPKIQQNQGQRNPLLKDGAAQEDNWKLCPPVKLDSRAKTSDIPMMMRICSFPPMKTEVR